jgi:putative oxidoreductase
MQRPRSAGRPLLAGVFISGGYDTFRNPKSRVSLAESFVTKITEPLGLTIDTEQLVKLNAVVQMAGGAALAFGVFPRVAAMALVGSLVPTTLAGHRFWDESDPVARGRQRTQFLLNTAVLGGLLEVIAAR